MAGASAPESPGGQKDGGRVVHAEKPGPRGVGGERTAAGGARGGANCAEPERAGRERERRWRFQRAKGTPKKPPFPPSNQFPIGPRRGEGERGAWGERGRARRNDCSLGARPANQCAGDLSGHGTLRDHAAGRIASVIPSCNPARRPETTFSARFVLFDPP